MSVTPDDLKKLARPDWLGLLDNLKAAHPIERVVEASGPAFRLQVSGAELRGVEHDSLVVTPHKGMYWWYSQNEAGDIFTWLMHRYNVDMMGAVALLANGIGMPTAISPRREPPPPSAEPAPLPQDLHIRYHKSLDPARREWWASQGITDQGIARFFLGVCDDRHDYGRAATIPIIEGGRLVNLRLRLMNPANPKDKYRPWDRGRGTQLYNSDILTPELGAVVVVAGEKKVVVLWEYGIPAVSPTGGCSNWKDEWTSRLQFCRSVYLCFDPTEQEAARRLAETIGERAFVATLPDKPDDWIRQVGRDEFRRALAQAEPYADNQYWKKQMGGRNLWGRMI